MRSAHVHIPRKLSTLDSGILGWNGTNAASTNGLSQSLQSQRRSVTILSNATNLYFDRILQHAWI